MVPRDSDASETLRRRELIVYPGRLELRPRPNLLYGSHASTRAERTNELPPANRSEEAGHTNESAGRRRRTNFVRREDSRRESSRSLATPVARGPSDIDRITRRTLVDNERASGLHLDENHTDRRLPVSREYAAGDPRAALGQRLPTKDATLYTKPPTNYDHHGQTDVPEPLVAAPVKKRKSMKNPEVTGVAAGQNVARQFERGPAPLLRAPRSKKNHLVPTGRFLAESMTAVNIGTRMPGHSEKQPVRVEVHEIEWRRQTDLGRINPRNPRANLTRKQKKERRPLARKETDRNGEVFAPASQPSIQRRQRRERPRPERLVDEAQVDVAEPRLHAIRAGKRPRDRALRQAPRRPSWNQASRPLQHHDDRPVQVDTSREQTTYRSRHGSEHRRFVV